MSKNEVGAIRGSNSAQELRRIRARRFIQRVLLWVGLPTLLAVVYYGFWASPQYQSVSIVSVQSNEGGKNTSSKRDAMLVREYSLSRTMLDHLVAEHQFNELYQSEDNDRWARLATDASTEALYEYYQDKVQMEYESKSGTLNLKVQAFTPEAAQALNAAIIGAAEAMSNEMYVRARIDRQSFAEEQLKKAEVRLGTARQAWVDLKASAEQPDPATGQASTSVMEARLESATIERDAAQTGHEAATAALENVRVQVLREKRYVVTIAPPSLPTGAIRPRRLWGIMTVFVLSIVLMGVLTMLAAAVREHARF